MNSKNYSTHNENKLSMFIESVKNVTPGTNEVDLSNITRRIT